MCNKKVWNLKNKILFKFKQYNLINRKLNSKDITIYIKNSIIRSNTTKWPTKFSNYSNIEKKYLNWKKDKLILINILDRKILICINLKVKSKNQINKKIKCFIIIAKQIIISKILQKLNRFQSLFFSKNKTKINMEQLNN